MTQIQFNSALMSLSDKLFYYALSLTSDRERANDLLQETFLKALAYRDKFTLNTNFKAWVYTIMKNTFINDYRRNSKMKSTFDGSHTDNHLSVPGENYQPTTESVINTSEIKKAIASLEDEYRIPFTMFVEGFKYKEIADELNLPLGTVKSRIFFTRKKLEAMLQEFAPN
jgi:RNA polymerase sigma-70 factor (ECF subfamily)